MSTRGTDGDAAALREVAARVARLRAVEADLQLVDAELRQLRSSEQRWQRQAARAAEQLERQRGFSPAALLARLTGRAAAVRAAQGERIDEARREQAALEARGAPLAARHAQLAAERATLAAATTEHAALLRAVEARVRADGGDAAARCDASAAELERLRGDERRVLRAIERARAGASSLAAARDELREPSGPLLAGGLLRAPFVAAGRSAQFDVARTHLERAQRELNELGSEARALAGGLEQLDPGQGLVLLQLATNGLLAELVGRARFADARTRITAALEHVREVLLGLERRAVEVRGALAAAQRQRDLWLESWLDGQRR